MLNVIHLRQLLWSESSGNSSSRVDYVGKGMNIFRFSKHQNWFRRSKVFIYMQVSGEARASVDGGPPHARAHTPACRHTPSAVTQEV